MKQGDIIGWQYFDDGKCYFSTYPVEIMKEIWFFDNPICYWRIKQVKPPPPPSNTHLITPKEK